MLPCPDCSAHLTLPDPPRVGALTVCENCGAEIEITGTDPLTIRTVEESK